MARNSFKNLAYTGFGLSFGIYGAQILFMLIGLAFFIPGYLMLQENRKSGEKDTGKNIGAIILIGLGVLIMGGLGFGVLLDSLSD